MEAHERQSILDQYQASHERMMALLEKLTPAQWQFRPGSGRWSIAECLEHVAAVEARVVGNIHKQLAGPPGDPEKLKETAGKDEMLAKLIPDRSNRVEAPEPVRPTGRWPEVSELLAHYQATRASTIRFVQETADDLRSRSWAHPHFGEMTCFQWLLAMSHHGDRHAKQIEEIRQHPEYPVV